MVDPVYGRNPANHLGCIKPCKLMRYTTYQLVQDFIHQQYHGLLRGSCPFFGGGGGG